MQKLVVTFLISTCTFALVSAEPRVSVDFAEAPLSDVAEYLRGKSAEYDPSGRGWNLLIDPSVDGDQPITLRLQQVPLAIVLAYAAELGDFTYAREEFAIVLRARDPDTPYSPPENLRRGKELIGQRAAQITLESFEAEAAPLGDVVRLLSDRSAELQPGADPLNFVLGPNVNPDTPVSLTLRNIPLASVAKYAAELSGLRIRVDGWAITFLDPDPPKVTTTESPAAP
ncbi:MAG: hypothetical protein AAF236_10640 [Verrucomicrobiota bacterium]